jgi:hypothetical protein
MINPGPYPKITGRKIRQTELNTGRERQLSVKIIFFEMGVNFFVKKALT